MICQGCQKLTVCLRPNRQRTYRTAGRNQLTNQRVELRGVEQIVQMETIADVNDALLALAPKRLDRRSNGTGNV